MGLGIIRKMKIQTQKVVKFIIEMDYLFLRFVSLRSSYKICIRALILIRKLFFAYIPKTY